MKENQWYFFYYTFNYETNNHFVGIKSFKKNEKDLVIDFGSDFKDFELGKTMSMNFGCFDNQKTEKISNKNCIDGEV